MRQVIWALVPALALAGTLGMAHQGVQNAAVLARMDGMKEVGAQMKILGTMAKGGTDFDAEAAAQALTAVSAEAARIPALFEGQETDPKSEALPAIWENWEDFLSKATAMETAAQREITSLGDVQAAMGALGATCKDCHRDYRK